MTTVCIPFPSKKKSTYNALGRLFQQLDLGWFVSSQFF